MPEPVVVVSDLWSTVRASRRSIGRAFIAPSCATLALLAFAHPSLATGTARSSARIQSTETINGQVLGKSGTVSTTVICPDNNNDGEPDCPPFASAGVVIGTQAGGGDGQIPAAIRSIFGSLSIVDSSGLSGGIQITKSTLTGAGAFGQGLPGGWPSPPSTQPNGPWQGLMWPYRDQFDFPGQSTQPLGNSVGNVFSQGGGFYGVSNITGFLRGGPLEQNQLYGLGNDRLQRSLGGDGVNTPIDFFALTITALDARPRQISISFSGQVEIIQRNILTNQLSVETVTITPEVFTFTIPAPGAVMIAAPALIMLRRRR